MTDTAKSQNHSILSTKLPPHWSPKQILTGVTSDANPTGAVPSETDGPTPILLARPPFVSRSWQSVPARLNLHLDSREMGYSPTRFRL